jgi:hypothetical protein
MRLAGSAAGAAVVALVFATPTVLASLLRGGEPIAAINQQRLVVLRLAMGAVGLGSAWYCFLNRNAEDYTPLQRLVFVSPLAALAIVMLYQGIFGVRDGLYTSIVREDGPVEHATAVVDLLAAAVACRAALLASHWQTRLACWLLTTGTLFIGLSEISFGQRILGLETPEALREINRQGEISLHNIRGVQSVVYLFMPLVIMAYALSSRVIARALARGPVGEHLSNNLLAIVPVPWYAVTCFLPMAIYCVTAWLDEYHVRQNQEPSELFMGIGFLLVALNAWWVLSGAAEGGARRIPADRQR